MNGIHEVIITYLRIILSWPPMVLVISIIFILKFSSSIKTFLGNIFSLKIGSVEISQKQEETNKDILEKRGIALTEKESYEFKYLSLFLVFNTRRALLWFYKSSNNSSTKNNFTNSYDLPPQIDNPEVEKEAIFNALLTNQLLEQKDSLFCVTEKGKRFLKYLGYNI